MALVEIDLYPDARKLRGFALGGAVICGAFGLLFAMRGWSVAAGGLWGAGAVGAALAVVRPAWLLWSYRVMIVAAAPIGVVVGYVILAGVYFLLITPMGLLRRLTGWDPLDRRFEPDRASYWTPHESVRDVRRYFRQY